MTGSNAQHHDDRSLSDEEFRKVVRTWIAENYPLSVRNPPHRLPFAEVKPWYMALSRRGWLAPGWPVEYGGAGLPITKQLILAEEQEAYGAARVNDMGVVMLGPVLLRFGTQEQRDFFLPKVLSGEHTWCQGYSEPGSGSDLASLRTEAVRDGDEWVINGQKIWTTRGADANWMFGLFRTSKEGKKQEGISFILVPMDSEGLSVRPIPDISGGKELCETFFDNVRVPVSNLVGELNKGWTVANALLGFERIFIGLPKQSSYALHQLEMQMRRKGLFDEPVYLEQYTRLRCDLEDHIALYEGFIDRFERAGSVGPEVSILKIHQSELFQRITDMLLAVSGEEAALLEPMKDNQDIFPSGQFLIARPATIYGGSSEIQRNIVAARVLGMPRA